MKEEKFKRGDIVSLKLQGIFVLVLDAIRLEVIYDGYRVRMPDYEIKEFYKEEFE